MQRIGPGGRFTGTRPFALHPDRPSFDRDLAASQEPCREAVMKLTHATLALRDMGRICKLFRVAADVRRHIGFDAMDGNVPDRPDLSREENEILRLMADGMSTSCWWS
jgi:hypothetical protein